MDRTKSWRIANFVSNTNGKKLKKVVVGYFCWCNCNNSVFFLLLCDVDFVRDFGTRLCKSNKYQEKEKSIPKEKQHETIAKLYKENRRYCQPI